MKLDEFWNLIEKVKAETEPNDQKAILAATKKALMEYSSEDIIEWVQIKTEYHKLAVQNHALWEECTQTGIDNSDDGFYYFAPWLIAQGKETYITVMNDPKTLSSYVLSADDAAFELYNYISHEAYSERVIRDSFTEKELEEMCKKWCTENADRIERYAYQTNVDMATGGEKLFWSHMHSKYNLFAAAEEKPLSKEMKQEIKESLLVKMPPLMDKIRNAEINNTETSDTKIKFTPER